jgi:hypothetical protein
VDVISLFMALLSSRGISTPSLQARGEQRRFFYFNNDRDIPHILQRIHTYKYPYIIFPSGHLEFQSFQCRNQSARGCD